MPLPLLLDTDLGSVPKRSAVTSLRDAPEPALVGPPDDELALALLWGSPEVDLLGVSTTYGDVARQVLGSGLPITVVGVDVTRQVRFREAEMGRFAACGELGRIVATGVDVDAARTAMADRIAAGLSVV